MTRLPDRYVLPVKEGDIMLLVIVRLETDRSPEMLDALMLLSVFPRTQEPLRFPKAMLDALMLLMALPPPTTCVTYMAPLTFAPCILLMVLPPPMNHPAVTLFVTVREVKVPTDVIFV